MFPAQADAGDAVVGEGALKGVVAVEAGEGGVVAGAGVEANVAGDVEVHAAADLKADVAAVHCVARCVTVESAQVDLVVVIVDVGPGYVDAELEAMAARFPEPVGVVDREGEAEVAL